MTATEIPPTEIQKKSRTPLILSGLVLSVVVLVSIVVNAFISRRNLLTGWLEKNPSVHLCGIRVLNGNRTIYITNQADLSGIDTGVRNSRRAPSGFGWPKTAYFCLNGKWCGQSVISWNHDQVNIGIPEKPLDIEFKFYEFSIPSGITEHLSAAVGPD